MTMKRILLGAVAHLYATACQPRRTPLTLLFAATVVMTCCIQPSSALQFVTDTVQSYWYPDTLLMTNMTQDTLTIDSITGRVLVLHTSLYELAGAVLVRNPSGPGGSNISFGCGDRAGDSLACVCGSGPSRIPPAYNVWLQSPILDAPPCPNAKRLNAAQTDTMAVMVTFHSGSGDDSVVFINTDARKACFLGVRESPTQRRPPAMSLVVSTLEAYTIRGERVHGRASATAPRSTAMLVVRQGHGGAASTAVMVPGGR
jgi:hypothetical protein